jgi:hypothetical protein
MGVVAGLMCFLLPRGVLDSIDGRDTYLPRFVVAVAVTLALGALIARLGRRPGRYAPVALSAISASSPCRSCL